MKLKINDIITRGNEKRKVLDVFTNTVIVSDSDNHDMASSFYTEKELLEEDWVFPEGKWEPECEEIYWYIMSENSVNQTANNASSDIKRIEIGNCYQTEALAQEALKRVLAAYKG